MRLRQRAGFCEPLSIHASLPDSPKNKKKRTCMTPTHPPQNNPTIHCIFFSPSELHDPPASPSFFPSLRRTASLPGLTTNSWSSHALGSCRERLSPPGRRQSQVVVSLSWPSSRSSFCAWL